ncbi:ribonuclease H-like domain-containing protein [Anaerosporobacter faecicola]|uniref:ribonuclease H-like domain-containing protein n=1 Tax=Anaerosporobacter faecicola TaxID=2718714 RepID=UPI001438DFB4|nr:ribonuclease H-like domain-containing protein [Anaerosporobacter faecicola]
MITIEKQLKISSVYSFHDQIPYEDIVFFDIETTGFSPNNTILYLIGCTYYKNQCWNLIQWFADDNTSEKKLLHAFFTFIKDYRYLMHFNGEGFDLPYIQKKCTKLGLDYTFDHIESYDIYKKVLPYKKIFKLENFKQKTLEHFLHIQRNDTYSGGELIQVYANYLGMKKLEQLKNRTHEVSPVKDLEARIQSTNQTAFGSPNSAQLLQLLLLHNAEDVQGMLPLTNILSYVDLFRGAYKNITAKVDQDQLVLHFTLVSSLPESISYGNDTIHCNASGDQAILKVTLYQDELKFFYDNYKDYYYLPKEDTAIHKSVAFYVDKNFRTRAKAANCYSKKTGRFVPQYEEIYTPHFKIDYHDKYTYVEVTDEFLQDTKKLALYIQHLLTKLISR